MRKYLIAICLCLVISVPFKTLAQRILGKYELVGKKDGFGLGWFIVLTTKNFLIFNDTPFEHIYTCCDTIAYGTWKFNDSRKHLLLTTTNDRDNKPINLQVSERHTAESDSTFITINSPIESALLKNRKRHDILRYYVYTRIQNKDSLLQESNDNHIRLEKTTLQNLMLKVAPIGDYAFRTLGIKQILTKSYGIKDISSDTFDIELPQLTYQFITYLRLKNSIVNVKNSKYLIWDGKLFRKRKGNGFE